MEKEKKKIRFLATVSDKKNGQETYGISSSARKSKIVNIEYSDLEKQLQEHIYPLIDCISDKFDKISTNIGLNKITVKLGASLEGKLFITSGKVDSSIEIEFCRK